MRWKWPAFIGPNAVDRAHVQEHSIRTGPPATWTVVDRSPSTLEKRLYERHPIGPLARGPPAGIGGPGRWSDVTVHRFHPVKGGTVARGRTVEHV